MDFQWKWQVHPDLDKIKWWKIICQEAEHLFCVPVPLPIMHFKAGAVIYLSPMKFTTHFSIFI